VLTAVLALALSFHPAAARPTFVHFQSPSGNINCLGSAAAPASVDCLVKRSAWPRKPPKPASCDLDWDPTDIALSHRRTSVGACRGDIGPGCGPFSGSSCTTLRYGRFVDIGAIRCTSAANGVTCRYRTAPRVGFRIAREGYVLFRS
jgi:hypothetical protein